MCSIEEAWGNVSFSQPMKLNNSGVTPALVQQQMQMNQERLPDVAGNLYTQTDDRRQWAMPETDVIYDDFNRGLMAKPAPDANGVSRGVHSKYSREKRFDSRVMDGGVMGKLVTDVDPKYYERTQPTNISPPAYMELYDKPFTEIGGVGIPLASNVNSEQFAEIKHAASLTKEKYTPEIITDPRILAEADNANHTVRPNMNNLPPFKANSNDSNLAMGHISSQLRALMTKVDFLEKKMTNIEHDKSHDIVLFIVLAIFVMFILDNVFNKKMFS